MISSVGPKFHLDSLQKLGIDRATRDQIAASIDKSQDAQKVDPYNYVSLSVLSAHAEKLGRNDVVGKLRGVLATKPSSAIKTKTDLAAFPTPRTSMSAAVSREAGSGVVGPADLAPYAKQLGALFASLTKEGQKVPDLSKATDARELLGLLAKEGRRLSALPSLSEGLTRPQIDKLLEVVASKAAPAHTERDLAIGLDSNYRKLAGSGAVSVFQKNQYEGFFVRRTEAVDGKPGFALHGFKSDRIAVALPKDASLLVIDSQGNERAAKLPRVDATIDGQKLSTVEISRTMVEPDSRNRVFDPSFAIKVLDAKGAVLFEQALAFDKNPTFTSNEIARGSFDYLRTAASELDRQILDRAIPTGSKNATPISRRPKFEMQGAEGSADRLVVERDGQKFPLSDLTQLLAPPKRATQAFAPEPLSGPKVTYELKDDPRSSLHLDEPNGSIGAQISTSLGKRVSFDSSLSQMMQARVGVGGVTVSSAEGLEIARFDPFDASADRNQRRTRS